MDLNSAIKILIDASLKGQESGLFSWYESREIANAVDSIEEISRQQQKNIQAQQEKKSTPKENEQPAIPPVARPQ